MARVNALFGGWTVAVLLFLYLPIVVLVIWSFNNTDYGSRWKGFTTKWYSAFWYHAVQDVREGLDVDAPKAGETAKPDAAWRSAVKSTLDWAGASAAPDVRKQFVKDRQTRIWDQVPGYVDAIWNSVLVGVVSTIVAVLLGTSAAWLTFKYKYPLHRTLTTLVAVPMIVPEIIMGVSLLSLITMASTLLGSFGSHIERGLLAVIVAHITFSFPYVMVTINARLAGIDPSLEEAAMDLGATPLKAFTRVVLPYLAPAVVSGALMAFTLSLDDFIVTYFVSDAKSMTLPLRIWGSVKGPPPMLHVVSSLVIGVTVLLVVISEGLKRRNRA